MAHLLATNDFPPKLGGIQSYLHELWRRLPPEEVAVYTTSYPGAEAFDSEQPFDVVRARRTQLWPTPSVTRQVEELAASRLARAVLIDPALPLGLVGRRLSRPYGLILHGAEVTVPGRTPGASKLLSSVLSAASFVLAAGAYPEAEARRAAGARLPPVAVIPPGVDVGRFSPLGEDSRRQVRERFGLPADCLLLLSLHRLVPRKGVDVLIKAVARLRPSHPELVLAVGGSGRDEARLRKIAAAAGLEVFFLGAVSEEEKPALYGAADVYSMCCRNRWGGLEQEGFGIVFLEAAACGVPQLAGRSGGAADAVVDGETGLVVSRPADVGEVTEALEALVTDAGLRLRLGKAARQRAEAEFSYDKVALKLERALEGFAAL